MATKLDKVIYTAHAHTTGGRDGESKSDDGKLSVKLSPPKEMGGSGAGTNPEQLFAAGYSACFMGAMVVSLVLTWLILKKIAVMPLVTGAVVLVFGGLTLWLQDDTFIKIKPTITNSLFAAVLLGGLLFKQSLLKYVFGDVYKLRPEGWSKLTLNWGLFFIVLAVINEVLWRNFSTDIWVAFKVWGVMPLTVIFSISQVSLLTKYAPEAEPAHVPPIVVES